ncbi:MAG: hypothetical protein BWX95_02714 [Bacteroidetes bacterium ADurb.Bin141]|nr:MAG: hypothetical protein BWX95_02714 [Bacteroidetes bacterium ADurb.Bin141]
MGLLIQQTVHALPEAQLPPSMIEMSAKFAQVRAQQLATDSEQAYPELGQLPNSATGCNLSVGTVELSDTTPSPDEVVIIVTGDIIQANNCH